MSLYEEFFTALYNVICEFLNVTGSYQDKAQKVYEEILDDLMQKGFPKEDISALCDAEDISRIFMEVDELTAAGYKIDKKSAALFRLCDDICKRFAGKGLDIRKLTTTEINNLIKCSKFISHADGIALGANIFGMVLETIYLTKEGQEIEAAEKWREFGYGLLGGTIFGRYAETLVASMVVSNPIAAVTIMLTLSLVGAEYGKRLGKIIDVIVSLYNEAGAYTFPVDPLILDLDGDGIETVSVENGVNFDFDSNGFAEKLGWVGSDDGLLVRDLNGNGQIDNGGELFGDLTLAEDYVAKNGFEALKYYDTNADGVIDNADAVYSELYVWKDAA